MTSILDHYKILGVNFGAGIAEVTSSYKKLCRLYHPDVSSDPESEELMKRINIAYTVLREKFKREAAFRERATYSRYSRRYPDQGAYSSSAETRRTTAESEKEAFSVVNNYFKAIGAFDYSGAYDLLSTYDKRHITRDSFIEWRTSVARLFPMKEFKIDVNSTVATVTFNDEKTLYARKFRVVVTEEDLASKTTTSGSVEKLLINEQGKWRIFLGYRNVSELTRTFDERFEAGRKRDAAKRFDEYSKELDTVFDMLSMAGMRKALSRELYRQKRFGGTLTFAAISVKAAAGLGAGYEELLRTAAATINKSLRQTDVPAYAGDGVFAILFVELRKKNAEYIIDRLAKRIRGAAGTRLGELADIEYVFESWSGSGFQDFDTPNRVLKNFRKKM